MSTQVLKFVDELKADSTLFSTILSVNSLSDVVEIAKSRGFDFTVEEFNLEANGQGTLKSSDLISTFGTDLEEFGSGPTNCPCTWQD